MNYNNSWEVVEAVSKSLNIKELDIVSRSRKTDIVDAKTIIAHILWEKTGLKLHLIYDVIYHNSKRKPEGRHCNIVNLLKRYEGLAQYDKAFKVKLQMCDCI
jgi:hypothetical protein